MEQKKQPAGAAVIGASIGMGIINGLFGAGGGMLAVVLLERFYGLEAKKAHATALIVMLPLTVLSVVIYFFRGALDFTGLLPTTPGMMLGSLIGAKLLGKVKNVWINRLFCALMIIAGIRMMV